MRLTDEHHGVHGGPLRDQAVLVQPVVRRQLVVQPLEGGATCVHLLVQPSGVLLAPPRRLEVGRQSGRQLKRDLAEQAVLHAHLHRLATQLLQRHLALGTHVTLVHLHC